MDGATALVHREDGAEHSVPYAKRRPIPPGDDPIARRECPVAESNLTAESSVC